MPTPAASPLLDSLAPHLTLGSTTPIFLWAGFVALVLVILFVDLFILGRKREAVPTGKALMLTGLFVTLGLAFSGAIYLIYENQLMGPGADGKPRLAFAGTPLTGMAAWQEYMVVWVLEYSMSVDNLFVFTLIFTHFAVPDKFQHRVLFWGILGAIVFRGAMILAGQSLVHMFEPMLILFGLVLLWTAAKMLKSEDEQYDPSKSIALKIARFFFPVTDRLHDDKFFIRHGMDQVWDKGHVGEAQREVIGRKALKVGALVATPLFLVLCVVEATDVLFAIDSVPAALGSSKEPFIIFTANVFAILGLRALYFAIARLMSAFRFLKVSLAVILAFIGLKMMLTPALPFIKTGTNAAGLPTHWQGLPLPTWLSLSVIGASLVIGIVLSLALPKKKEA